MAEISVIVPVYKVEPYLRRCVDSILAQTFTDIEVILVDDGSPDGCPAICDEYARQDSRVKVIHQQNGGLSAARNSGINYVYSHSTSSYIGFIDSDDWIHPQMYEVLFLILKKYGAKMSICNYKDMDSYHKYNYNAKEEALANSKKISRKEALKLLFCADNDRFGLVMPKLYSRELFMDRRFVEGILYEDVKSSFRILYDAEFIAVTDVALYYYYYNPSGITKSVYNRKRLDIMDAMEDQLQFFKEHHYYEIYSLAVKKYLFLLCYHGELAHNSLHDSSIDNRIYNRLKQLFKEERKRCHITPKNSPHCYNRLFPRIMPWYWRINALKEKLGL